MNRKQETPLPDHANDKDLADEFSKFFNDKIEKIRSKLQDSQQAPVISPSTFNGTPLTHFRPMESNAIRRLINKMATKHSDIDPLSTWLMKDCLDEFLPTITKIVNTSLHLGIMPKC